MLWQLRLGGPIRINMLDTETVRSQLTISQFSAVLARWLPKDCVIHSLRHTFLTRFGEAGADAFTIKKVAGHSSVTISEALYSSYAGRPGARFGAFHHSEQQASKTIRSRYKFRYITKLIACKFLCPCS